MIKEFFFKNFYVQIGIEKLDGIWFGFEIGKSSDFQVWVELFKINIFIMMGRL